MQGGLVETKLVEEVHFKLFLKVSWQEFLKSCEVLFPPVKPGLNKELSVILLLWPQFSHPPHRLDSFK